MKLRYYLRGLGIGMFVTALLMGVALKGNSHMSDAEIRVRAMELGMVDGDSRTLTDIQNSQRTGTLSSGASDSDGAPEGDPGSSAPTAAPAAPAGTPTPEPSPTATPDPLKPLPMVTLKPPQTTVSPTPNPVASVSASMPDQLGSVMFVIQKGQSSDTVSKGLAEAGLVEDASDFDQFLQTNRYAGTIHAGTFEIPVDATQEEIAQIITGRR